jgi:hypothetical protein
MKNSGFKYLNPASDKFKYETDSVEIKIKNHKHPIFCFRYQHKDFNILDCNADEKVSLIEQMCRLSELTWEDIKLAPCHGLGAEKIYKDRLKAKCPEFITDDVQYLLAFRFQGKKPFLVHRDRFIAHVIFIDNKFTLYKH